MKEIREDLNKWKDILCSWIGRLNTITRTILKAVYRFSAISVKIPMVFSTEIEKKNLKFMWNIQGSQIAKTILNKVGGHTS